MVVHMKDIFKYYEACFETLGLYAMRAKLNFSPFVDSFFSPRLEELLRSQDPNLCSSRLRSHQRVFTNHHQ
jgi:hypothetical protein